MTRSYVSSDLVSAMAVRAGYYQAQAEMMQSALRRFAADPDSYASKFEMLSLAKNDMDAELAAMLERNALERVTT